MYKATQSFDIIDGEGNVTDSTLIEDCESIDTSQIVPTLLGAVQMLMKKVEKMERVLKRRKRKPEQAEESDDESGEV